MIFVGAGMATLVLFVLLLRLALPHKDGTLSWIASGEHRTAAYSILLVGTLLAGFALIMHAVMA
jgi:hypothetical protein